MAKKGHAAWNKGKPRSDEVKKKISQSVKGFKHTDEAKDKMRKSQAKRRAKPGYVNPNKGRKDSKETREKKSAILRERYKDKTKHPMYGKKDSKETREKKRKAHTGLKATDETKKKQRRSQLGHSVSKEARRKSSERNKGKDWHKNRDKVNQKARMVREQIKYEVFSEYSKRLSNSKIPCCRCCGEKSFLIFLTIDHITNRKNVEHEKSMGGNKLYRWLKGNNYPRGFQVLCWNCNSAKSDSGMCPHKRSMK